MLELMILKPIELRIGNRSDKNEFNSSTCNHKQKLNILLTKKCLRRFIHPMIINVPEMEFLARTSSMYH